MKAFSASLRSGFPARLPVSHLMRPERHNPRSHWLDRMGHEAAGLLPWAIPARLAWARRLARAALRLEQDFIDLDGKALLQRRVDIRRRLLQQGFADTVVIEATALVREAARRSLGMAHFEVQLIGGLLLLRGTVAEMATGEGKTLTATLPAAIAALAGVPVHVVSVNDYLTARDAETMSPLFAELGLSVGTVVHGLEPMERREQYGNDITYCTNKELVFDYLKDRITLARRSEPLKLQADRLAGPNPVAARLLLRGLHFAIVDEIDSVLVDEARTPLIISQSSGGNVEEADMLRQALEVARGLSVEQDYTHDQERRSITLTDSGRLRIIEQTEFLGPYWQGRIRREEAIRQALSALLLFERDRHYLVRDNKVQIIDEFTGRVMADRTWERGLHQLIEIKEECELTAPTDTLAQISYQRFFRRYHHLSGMTGTAREIRRELWTVYALRTAPVPLNRPSRRQRLPDSVYVTADEKWQAVLDRLQSLNAAGRPVLVGTNSVESSDQLGQLLERESLPHRVLNAKQDAEEAAIVAQAGGAGQITVATSMAGRGTDIKLQQETAESGGLHVILTECHDAARVDRQLEGRCARQGDPGSFEAMISLQDTLLTGRRGGIYGGLARSRLVGWLGLQEIVGRWATRRAQRRLEKIHRTMRRMLLKYDEQQRDLLAFSGRQE